ISADVEKKKKLKSIFRLNPLLLHSPSHSSYISYLISAIKPPPLRFPPLRRS
ncbi:hypothetical protein LINGRAHAP2_LOCUS15181, partial [Linum grandiflorum]